MNKVILFCLALLYIPIQASSQGIIIDHNCTDLSAIPVQWIDSAKSNLKIAYQHSSHGSQLISGIDAISITHGTHYNFTISNWGLVPGVFINNNAMPSAIDLGYNGDLSWQNATITFLNTPGCDRNVILWAWCGGVSANDSAGIYAYLNAMNQLESMYPNVSFVYMTGHLDGTGVSGNLNQMNNLIRNYCILHNKVLFDFADIESYAPGNPQNYMSWCSLDGLNYDPTCIYPSSGPNWGMEWMTANPTHQYVTDLNACSSCAHSDGVPGAKLNCILKGNAFWWLLARLAGWQSTNTKQLNVKLYLQGLFNGINMNKVSNSSGYQFPGSIADEVYMELHSAQFPYGIIGSQIATFIDVNGNFSVSVPGQYNNQYYIVVKSRNHIETWSGLPVSFASTVINYDFTTSAEKAFGSNMISLSTGKFGFYSGDVNQNGFIELDDINTIYRASWLGVSGYLVSDLDGDGYVELDDVNYAYINNKNGIGMEAPYNQ